VTVGRKLGFFGGTFDPIHCGHLILAEQAREQLELDQVLFVPACVPPHKPHSRITDSRRRLEMVQLAIAGNPAFLENDLEIRRGGISFTVESLEQLRQQAPDDELYVLMGSDSLAEFPTWYRPDRIVELAMLVVAGRRHPDADTSRLPAITIAGELPVVPQMVIDVPFVDIRGTDIRRRVADGRSIRYLVPAAVEAYIASRKLYQTQMP
jgi:nicotinate-nucleotide adenylyltransferase